MVGQKADVSLVEGCHISLNRIKCVHAYHTLMTPVLMRADLELFVSMNYDVV